MQCRDCPLNLVCYAGKLTPINWCPECHYLVCANGSIPPYTALDIIGKQLRLRCEPRTEEMLRWYGVAGGVVRDPVVAKNQMGVTKCSKCDAKDRIAKGMKTAFNPEEFDAVELD